MHYHKTVISAWLSCTLALLGGVVGLFWARQIWLTSDALFPILILGVWLAGSLWAWYTLWIAYQASRSLRTLSRSGRHGLPRQSEPALNAGGGVFGPLGQLHLTHPRASKESVLDCVDECLQTFSLRGMRYVSGSLIFLGLVGTLYGLSDALRGLSVGINALVGDDSALFLSHLKQQLQNPLAGMAAAFSASLLGVAGTLTMGFFVWQWERARQALRLQAEHWAKQAFCWRPEGETWWGGDASAETLASWLKGVEALAAVYGNASIHHEALAKGTESIGQQVDALTSVLRMHYQEAKEWHQDQLINRQVLEHIQRQLHALSREKAI